MGKGMGGGRGCGERDVGRDSREKEAGRGLWGKGWEVGEAVGKGMSGGTLEKRKRGED